jgi:hypothetical protein
MGQKTLKHKFKREFEITMEIERANTDVIDPLIAPWARDAMLWVPHRTMNSYPRDYEAGDFILHAASGFLRDWTLRNHIREKFLQSLELNNIITEDELFQHIKLSNSLWWKLFE